VLFLCPSPGAGAELIDILQDELNREMAAYATQESPPYYISYRVTDLRRVSARGSFGSLITSDYGSARLLTVEVRVGDYRLDNTHELRDQYTYSPMSNVQIAIEDNPEALTTALWQETNRCWRQAVEQYAKVRTNVAMKVAEEDSSADFSREKDAAMFIETAVDTGGFDALKPLWEGRVKAYSAPFLGDENIYGGRSSYSYTVERSHFVSSEGARIAQNRTYARLSVSGFIKSDDGMELPLYRNWSAFTSEGLPGDGEILAAVDELVAKLTALRNAPVVDPYTGPAILSGRAASVFFHEILGHRVEGHRQKSESEGQTFKKFVGERILPENIDIVFDPGERTFGSADLMGYYRYDDQGVPGRRVTVVDDGILRKFLMSRSPIEGFPLSNGHGRAQPGYSPVSRQSNMIVTTSSPRSDRELRERLVAMCREQGKSFGLLFGDIEGGFTFTGRSIPNVFNLLPTEVYRVYVDGRPDELVRGVDLVGTPLVMFSMIREAGDTPKLFSGMCGAESGSVPVSAVSPALLVEQVEVQKKSKSQDRPPILPRPGGGKYGISEGIQTK